MGKLKTFFYLFRRSAFDAKYYQEVLKAPFRFSLKYFLFLFFTIGFLMVFGLSFFLITEAYPYLSKIDASQFYPENLTINIRDGQVSTNVEEPFFVPLKPSFFSEEIGQALKQQPIQNVLVIDTKAQPLDIKEYQTFTLLTKDSISFIGEGEEIQTKSLEDLGDFTLDKEKVEEAWQEIIPLLKWVMIGLVVFLFLFVPSILVLVILVYLLFISLLSWLTAKIFELKISYFKALQINLHAITLLVLVNLAFYFLGVTPRIPFFQTITLLLFNLIIFASVKTKKRGI